MAGLDKVVTGVVEATGILGQREVAAGVTQGLRTVVTKDAGAVVNKEVGDLLTGAAKPGPVGVVPPAPNLPSAALATAGTAGRQGGEIVAAATTAAQDLAKVEAQIAPLTAKGVVLSTEQKAALATLRQDADTLRGKVVTDLSRRAAALETAIAKGESVDRAGLASLKAQFNEANLAMLRSRSVNLLPKAIESDSTARLAHQQFAQEAAKQAELARAAGNLPRADALTREAAGAFERAAKTGGPWVDDIGDAQRLYTQLGDADGLYRLAGLVGKPAAIVEGTLNRGQPDLARKVADLARANQRPPLPALTDAQFRTIRDQLPKLSPNGPSILDIFLK